MKAEIQIETEQLGNEIVKKVLDGLKTQQSEESKDTLFTVETLAEYLQVSKQWIYERVQFKEIPHIKVRKLLRFRKSQIDKWLDGYKVPAASSLSRLPGMSEGPTDIKSVS
ncbi:MAG: excisionase family DNA-binding protein [Proteobacteria bacterium]|nr:excisionase family DNA-binding protein [Pseudomonadota bacterium]